jgi:RHS repeat-associated protein
LLTYDAQGFLETVTDSASGRMVTFHYANGLLDYISGPTTPAVSNGIWVTYGYDGSQNLTSVTYADGSGFTYTYNDANDAHNLTERRNKANHLINTWAYDSQDRCTDNFSVSGAGVTLNYVSAGQVDVTDAYGTLRTYTVSEISGRKRVTALQGAVAAPYDDNNIVRWQYDTDLNLMEVETAAGTIHQYQNYDQRENPRTIVLASGAAEQRTITYTYHPAKNSPLTRTEPSVLGTGDKVTTWDYDSDYDATPNENPTHLLSRLIEQGFTRDAAGATIPYEYITTFTYNEAGQVAGIDGPRTGASDVTSINYYPNGDLDYITRSLIGTAYFNNYNDAGQLGRVTDVNDQSEVFSYDGRGRITGVTHEADASVGSVSYNLAGLPEAATDEDGIAKSYAYDVNGRLYRIHDADGNYQEYLYDAQGNLIEKSSHDPAGDRSARRRWSYQHPVNPGKLWQEIKADGSYKQYGYDSDGNINAVTDFNGNTTAYDYDPLNRLTTITQPGSVLTSYDYDGHGNLVLVMDAENHETTYTYDDLGRLVSSNSADVGVTGYVYDAAGNRVQKTDAMGVTVQYTYDALSRLTEVLFPDASQNITYAYDAGSFGLGRLTGMTDPAGTAGFEYDGRGRFISKGRTIAGHAYLISRAFSPGGRLSSFTYPSGRTIDYTRQSSGRIQQATTTYNLTTLTLVSNLSYNPFGPAKGLDTGSGGAVNNKVDQNGDLEIINSGQPMQQKYKYDANRNLLSILAVNMPRFNQAFTYDALNRLLGANTVFGTLAYTYDDVGNRLTRTVNGQADSYTYQAGTNRLAQVTGANPAAFSYDANGNITDVEDRTFVYNQNNRLIRVEDVSGILAVYTYNGLGQREIKEVDGVTTIFHCDFDGNLISESRSDGTMNIEYLYVDQSRMAMVESDTGKLFFYHNNYLGTPVLMTDDTGTVVWEADYKPFGEASVNPNSAAVNNFRFAGQYYDSETGLHYNWHRYYDPTTGRYLTPDPIGLLGGINLYAYALNNPINFTDPYGNFAITGPVIAGFILAKALGIGVAWGGLQIATYAIGDPLVYPNDPCAQRDYHVSDMMNDMVGGIATGNATLIFGMAGIGNMAESGAVLYPGLMTAAGSPQGQKVLSNATDIISAAVPSTSPAPNLAGAIGYGIGATPPVHDFFSRR